MKPVLILENPKYSGNIGMICRLVANFSLEPLRIIGEKKYEEPEMKWMAMNSEEEVDKIQYYPNIKECANDLDLLIGTSMIFGKDKGNILSISESIPKAKEVNSFGLLFGREDTGLTKKTTDECQYLINFFLEGKQSSMNLAQSVAYVLGAYFNQISAFTPTETSKISIPSNLRSIIQEVFELVDVNQFHGRENLATKRFTKILEESNLNQEDINFLFKIFQSFKNKLS
jgi:tRNA/rRNA methyltransferase